MNILHLAPQSPRKNGIIDYAQRYRDLINQNTPNKIDLFIYDEKVNQCEVNILQLWNLYKLSTILASKLKENKYDIIHAEIGTTCYPEFYLLYFLSFQSISVPIVITFHDPPHLILDPIKHFGLSSSFITFRAIKRVLSTIYSGIMEERVLAKSSKVFILSEVGYNIACQRFKKHCSKFIPLKHFTFNDSNDDLMVLKKENIILSAGFWTPRRGVEVLLEALYLLREKSPVLMNNWKVSISGGILDDVNSNKYYQHINNMIQKGKWGNTIETNKDLQLCSFETLFKRAAVYVSSDINKGRRGAPASGNLLRAMGYGCAIVASDMPGRNEIVEDGVNGLIYPSNDPNKLCQILYELLNSENIIKMFQNNNINIIKEQYDGKSIVNKFIYQYKTVVN